MNTRQTAHLNYILEATNSLLSAKYVKGSIEHQSELNRDYTASELLDMAIDEAIDQVTYLLTLKEKLDE